MPEVVLDSSVLISAFLTPVGVSAQVLRAGRSGAFVLHLSPEIIAEVATKLHGKPKLAARYGFSPAQVRAFCDDLAVSAQLVGDLPRGRFVPGDPKDDPIVATAVVARADYLVTGDRRHLLSLGAYRGIRIATPRELLDVLTRA